MCRAIRVFVIGGSLILSGFSCHRSKAPVHDAPPTTLFTSLPPGRTGIDFINQVDYTEAYNPYTFRNFYNGGGVAIGDVNNDGLPDLFFCGNIVDNRLYLNRGNFQFEDVTRKAGVAAPGVWTAGVAMADVNGDGWLDIYLCKSGDPNGRNRNNELFLNNGADENGQVTFTEVAKQYGIADLGLSTHGAFFDYDGDGDLDLYLLNNSIRSVGGYDLKEGRRNVRDSQGGNKLYRNEGNHFTDVSEQAGIYGSNIGFGLGVTIGDVDRDGRPDIYVSNDFFERDYLYVNRGNGTFEEALEQRLPEISLSSMGADMADLNNDGFPEIFVTDMLPRDEARLKTKTAFDNWNKYEQTRKTGYHRQFTRNVLQLNNGDGTFSEIGRMAAVEATDWSWGALIFDMDNDGLKDIFVANGIYKDLTDQDYINFYSDPETVRALMRREKGVITRLIDAVPSEALPNYAFLNNGWDSLRGLTFTDKAATWGLGEPGFSNGSAYGDLDNDGDLDLVTNNVNMPPFVFRNESNVLAAGKSNYLAFDLVGKAPNTSAIGAQITLRAGNRTFFQECFPMRGFESCVDPRPLFGLGELKQVDSVIVRWPDGRYTVLTGVPANQRLKIKHQDARADLPGAPVPVPGEPLLKQAPAALTPAYRHIENDFSDFDRDRLIYHMLSSDGPRMATGDVNGDGLEDFFVGGAKDSPGALFVRDPAGGFRRTNEALLEADRICEDTDAELFDADRDGDLDLYVCSGGNEFPSSSSALADRLYLNNGRGQFSKSPQVLPSFQFESSSCVSAADFDGDGDQDLFVGVRLRPFLYGVPVRGYILQNDGRGQFADVTAHVAPALASTGMITDAAWFDYDGDRWPDLVIAGEYTPVRIFKNKGGRLTEAEATGLDGKNGWWNRIAVAELNGDNRPDLVLGNHGLNTRFRAAADRPVTLYINDFDHNGSAEQVMTVYNGNKAYPLPLLHDLVKQMPSLRKRYLKYASYKEQTINDIFAPDQQQGSVVLTMNYPQTAVALSDREGRYRLQALPAEAQLAPVFAIAAEDVNGDGFRDLLVGGNFSRAKPETGCYASGYGLLLLGDGKGNFQPLPSGRSGLRITGEVRDIRPIGTGKQRVWLVARNNEEIQAFQ